MNDQDLRDQPIRTQATLITNNVKSARLQYVAKTSLKTNEVSQRAAALEALVNQQQAEILALKLQLEQKATPSLAVPDSFDEESTAPDEEPVTAAVDLDDEHVDEAELPIDGETPDSDVQ